jgi:hypothetical protein
LERKRHRCIISIRDVGYVSQLVLDAAAVKMDCRKSGEVDLRAFARQLGQLGHYVWLRNCVPSSSKKEGLRLKHSFLVCGKGGRKLHSCCSAAAGCSGTPVVSAVPLPWP